MHAVRLGCLLVVLASSPRVEAGGGALFKTAVRWIPTVASMLAVRPLARQLLGVELSPNAEAAAAFAAGYLTHEVMARIAPGPALARHGWGSHLLALGASGAMALHMPPDLPNPIWAGVVVWTGRQVIGLVDLFRRRDPSYTRLADLSAHVPSARMLHGDASRNARRQVDDLAANFDAERDRREPAELAFDDHGVPS